MRRALLLAFFFVPEDGGRRRRGGVVVLRRDGYFAGRLGKVGGREESRLGFRDEGIIWGR